MNKLIIAVTSITAILSACGGNNDSPMAEAPVSCNSAQAAGLDEGFVGNTSDDPTNPTPWTLGAGANILKASTMISDDDYITFNVGNCDSLDSITLTNYTTLSNNVNTTFMAIQRGISFTVTPETVSTRSGELLGYTNYSRDTLNQDVLALASQGQNAIGFTAPLQSGNYTIWLNQTGEESQFTLVFNVSRVEP